MLRIPKKCQVAFSGNGKKRIYYGRLEEAMEKFAGRWVRQA